MAKQKVQGDEQQTGTPDENYNLISALYHLLKGASNCEQYIRDAQEAGDQELVQFFKDWQDEQRNFSERAKNLLGSKMAIAQAGIGGGQRSPAVEATSAARSTTNASVKSGGNAKDDIVDEQSKESFPASDSPAKY
jgi:hypothetical protein